MGFPGGSVVKNPPANAGDVGSARGSGRPPGEENGNPLQYSCLGISIDRGAWQAIVHGVTKESDMTELLNNTTGGYTDDLSDRDVSQEKLLQHSRELLGQ